MTTFEIRTGGVAKVSLKYRIVIVLLFIVVFFAVDRGLRFNRSTLEIAITGVAVGSLMAYRGVPLPSYRLFVDDDSMTGVSQYSGWAEWLVTRRTVRKGMVRSVFRVKGFVGISPGIGVSERTQFGARVWGFIYIPESLPEFDQLKALAESWRLQQ